MTQEEQALRERVHQAVMPWIDVYHGPSGDRQTDPDKRPWVDAILEAVAR